MESLETGTLGINDPVPTTSQCPFGGVKQSGWGRELGSEGISAFLESKHVSLGLLSERIPCHPSLLLRNGTRHREPPAYFRRHYPKLVEAKRLLGKGIIGTPVMGFASCSAWISEIMGERSWFLDPERAGSGPLYDIGSHRIDAMNFLLGDPVQVKAQMNTAVRPFPVEDGATVLIEYSSGARAVVDARWNTRIALNDFRIVGTDGILELGPLDSPLLQCGDLKQHLPCDENRHFPCIEAFVAGILDGKPVECSAVRVSGTAWVLDAARREWLEAPRMTAIDAPAQSTPNLGST